MIGKYYVHTAIDLKNDNCDSKGYRLVEIQERGG